MKKIILFLFFVSALSWPVCSNADLVSTFDIGDEGWSNTGDVHPIEWENSGGNPGGFVKGKDDVSGRWWFFVAPDSWAGDWSQYINGQLSFDLIMLYRHGSDSNDQDAVRIYYGSDEASDFYAWGRNEIAIPPLNSWKSYEITLDSSTFTDPDGNPVDAATFNSNMSHVTGLWIRGEYINGDDTEGLDNVRVSAVPVPGALWLLGSGIIGLIAIKRKK